MPMLGDLLAAARDGAGQFHLWLEASDPALAEAVAEAAQGTGIGPTGFVRMAVADFARLAAEEDWATLISSLRDSGDPGTVCLLAMVHWRLTVSGCAEHGMGLHDYHGGAADERSEERHGH
ncbi:MAG: hypothetical protein ACXWUP_07775 [Allosphingosinicella sp.]